MSVSEGRPIEIDSDGGDRRRTVVILATVGLCLLGSLGLVTFLLLRPSDGNAQPGPAPLPTTSFALPTTGAPTPGATASMPGTAGPEITVAASLGSVTTVNDVCPGQVRVTGTIEAPGGPATVRYRWMNSDGRTTDPQTVSVRPGAAASVGHAWSVGEATRYDGETWLELLAPVATASQRLAFSVRCTAKVGISMPGSVSAGADCGAGTREGAFTIRAKLTVNAGPQPLTYYWSDGVGEEMRHTIDLAKAGSVDLVYRWPGDPDPFSRTRGEVKLIVVAPARAEYRTAYTFLCNSPIAPSTAAPGG